MTTKTESPINQTNGRVFLDRSAILTSPDVQTEELNVPEWGGWLRVRGLTGKQRDEYETSITIGKGKNQEINTRNARAKLVVMCLVDEAGQPLFSRQDVVALGEKSAAALQRVFDVARRLSGLSEEDMEELTETFD